MSFEWKHKYNITRADGSPIDWDDEGTGVCAGTLKLSKEVNMHKLLNDLLDFNRKWIGVEEIKGGKLKNPRWRDLFPIMVENEVGEIDETKCPDCGKDLKEGDIGRIDNKWFCKGCWMKRFDEERGAGK